VHGFFGYGTIGNPLRFALGIFNGKFILILAFVAACGPLQTHFHQRVVTGSGICCCRRTAVAQRLKIGATQKIL
jgi:hypothetical protein